jgi:hypothetical protein
LTDSLKLPDICPIYNLICWTLHKSLTTLPLTANLITPRLFSNNSAPTVQTKNYMQHKRIRTFSFSKWQIRWRCSILQPW